MAVDKKILAGVDQYLVTHYIPEDDDIYPENEEVRSFFDKISAFRKKKAENREEGSDISSDETLTECEKSDFDASSITKEKIIQPLSKSIVTTRRLDDVLGQLDETFSQKLLRMIKDRNMSEAEVYKKAFVDRRHFSKIKKDAYYTPNKKTVLAFAIALELSVDETKDLLSSAGYAFSRSSKFDVIVAYFLKENIYDMFELNEVLYEYGQPVFE